MEGGGEGVSGWGGEEASWVRPAPVLGLVGRRCKANQPQRWFCPAGEPERLPQPDGGPLGRGEEPRDRGAGAGQHRVPRAQNQLGKSASAVGLASGPPGPAPALNRSALPVQIYVSYDYGAAFTDVSDKFQLPGPKADEEDVPIISQFYHSPADNKRVGTSSSLTSSSSRC